MARHVHADLYEEAVNDLSIKWQYKESCGNWLDVNFNFGLSESIVFHSNLQYRKKPREFKEGHWYPVSVEWGDYEDDLVLKFKGEFHHGNEQYSPEQFKWIGESLGELKFG